MNLGLDGWLKAEPAERVHIVPSPRACVLNPGIAGVVWHWTGGPCLGPAFEAAEAAEISTWNAKSDRAASWHFLVAKDGRIFQSVPTTRGSWHVGRPGIIGGQRRGNVNECTVGIELANAGKLEVASSGVRCEGYPDARYALPVERAIHVGGDWYDEFPLAQIEAAGRLLKALVERHELAREACGYGHRDFDSPRKIDPGPLWVDQHLPRVLDSVFRKVAQT